MRLSSGMKTCGLSQALDPAWWGTGKQDFGAMQRQPSLALHTGSAVAQVDGFAGTQRGLPTDAGLDHFYFFPGFQEKPGLLFDRFRGLAGSRRLLG